MSTNPRSAKDLIAGGRRGATQWSGFPGSELDFIESRGIGQRVYGVVPQLTGNFDAVPVAPGHERNLVLPDLATYGGDGIAEGAVSLWVPGSGRRSQRDFGGEVVRPESNQREQAKQRRGGAHDREVGPLPLGFDAEMGTSFLKGDFQLPARDEPLEDIDGGSVEIGAEEGLRR